MTLFPLNDNQLKPALLIFNVFFRAQLSHCQLSSHSQHSGLSNIKRKDSLIFSL